MAFRGFFQLNGVELSNSSRVVAHLGTETPTSDAEVFGGGSCGLVETETGSGLMVIPAGTGTYDDDSGLFIPIDGSELYDPGLFEIGDCWTVENLCHNCRPHVGYDDSWADLKTYLGDTIYRPELAPWYTTRAPESAEFGGVWVMTVDGFGPAPMSRTITELAGAGGAAGPHRDTSRTLKFDALLIACTNAGLTYGTEWLACLLRETKARTDSTLRYLSAHPGGSVADPDTLLRELHGVVLTKALTVDNQFNPGSQHNRQATMYRVSWEMTACNPYVYAPQIDVPVSWGSSAVQQVSWVHAADCVKPSSCEQMPVLFSADCEPEEVLTVNTPPPSCGGCLPVCEIITLVFELPHIASPPALCTETVISTRIRNSGENPLTLQAYWRICGTEAACEDNRWPLQVAGLPPAHTLVLDGISGRYWTEQETRRQRPVGIVSTPSGSPWLPPSLDREDCWELVVLAASDAVFTVELSLADREA